MEDLLNLMEASDAMSNLESLDDPERKLRQRKEPFTDIEEKYQYDRPKEYHRKTDRKGKTDYRIEIF